MFGNSSFVNFLKSNHSRWLLTTWTTSSGRSGSFDDGSLCSVIHHVWTRNVKNEGFKPCIPIRTPLLNRNLKLSCVKAVEVKENPGKWFNEIVQLRYVSLLASEEIFFHHRLSRIPLNVLPFLICCLHCIHRQPTRRS